MKGIVTAVLVLLVGLALSAIAVSSASAASYNWCRPMKKGEYTTSTCAVKASKPGKGTYELKEVETCEVQAHGEYTDATCTTKAAKAGKGQYEKTEGRKFTIEGEGGRIFLVPSWGNLSEPCTFATGTGEITGPKTAVERIVYENCGTGGEDWESGGTNGTDSGKAGDVETNLLSTRLVGHGESVSFLNAESGKTEIYEPAVGEVGLEVKSAEHEPYLWQADRAGSFEMRELGEITGVYEPSSVNHLTTETETEVEIKHGAQGLLAETETYGEWTSLSPAINEQTHLKYVTEEAIKLEP